MHIYNLVRRLFLIAAMLIAVASGNARQFVLVLDAGHGGKDAGAIGKFSKEKNINLNVTLRVGALIEKNCPDVKVVYTRKTDVFVELHERANIANRNKADLFISIHTNAVAGRRQVVGAETYSLGMARAGENLDVAKRENSVILYESNYNERYAGFNPNSSESYIIFDFMQDQYMKQSAQLAKCIQQQYVSQAKRPDKGVHQAGFLVLRETSMPSVLTELGFISTPSEETYLNSAQGTDQLARSIYQGFVNYRKAVGGENTTVRPNTQEGTAQPQPAVSEKAEEKTKENNVAKEDPKENTATTTEDKAEDKEKGNNPDDVNPAPNEKPIFKIQIHTAGRNLRQDHAAFKGLTPIENYKEGNIVKFTYGKSSEYKDIVALRKSILSKFPDCFIVAFVGDKKISIQEALNWGK